MNHNTRARSAGAQPQSGIDEAAAARTIRKLFSDVAGRYDLLNHLLSFHVDRYWRAVTARHFDALLSRPGARMLDLCCGTADLGIAFLKRKNVPVIFCDFSHPMLVLANEKLKSRSLPVRTAEADALKLPFADASYDLVACSFGFRNLTNYREGLREIWRVLRPGGAIGILEFSKPRGRWIGAMYSFYFHKVLPTIGEWISGVPGSYSYLPGSVDRFPEREEFLQWMSEAHFLEPQCKELTQGIAVLFSGKKPE